MTTAGNNGFAGGADGFAGGADARSRDANGTPGPRTRLARRVAVELFVTAAVGAVFGLLGPFGSFPIPLGERLIVWVLLILGGYFIFRPLGIVARWAATAARVPLFAAELGAALLAAVPMSFVVAASFRRLYGVLGGGNWFAELYPQVLLVGVLMRVLVFVLFERERVEADAPASAAPLPGAAPPVDAAPPLAATPPRSRFLDRLPPGLGRLRALEMEDHYVRAHGAAGSTLVLLRMRDAVAELGADGTQVHRSWWVAKDAVERVERDGRNLRLRLAGGLLVPVSRAQAAEVRAWAEAACRARAAG